MDIAGLFKKHEDEAVFIKTTARPACEGALKVTLNRKANVLYNEGDIEGARRIFVTTGYTDGLTRIGDHYKAQGRLLDALQMYQMAPNPKRITELSVEFALMLKGLLKEEAKDV
ncbi:MAG: hypothetical protein LBG72_02585 [Spirochaetaceae bacterium]|jgi:hypothetical protein|nr:hypothetical protein [Spirochaetaceae bacterium]